MVPPLQKAFRICARIVILLVVMLPAAVRGADGPRELVFEGVLCEHRLALKDIDPAMPSDWTGYTHLVIEMRTTSPQRFALWAYTADGPRRIELQPFGQNVWLRASVPLRYFVGMDKSGTDLASTNNRRTNSFWMSVWGPFGELKSVEALGFAMQYPINRPTIELRSIHLAKQDEGSEFLEGQPVVDEFGQWAHVDDPRKIHSREQLAKELADEEKTFGSGADFDYCELGGYKDTPLAGRPRATGFFHVEQIDGIWWFVDPHGHLFLSISSNGLAGFGGGTRGGVVGQPATATRTIRRPRVLGPEYRRAGPPQYYFPPLAADAGDHIPRRARRLRRGVRARHR